MKEMHKDYWIPIGFFVFGLVWVHSAYLVFLVLVVAGTFLPLLGMAVVVVPLLLIVGFFRNFRLTAHWLKIGFLSLLAFLIAPAISSVPVNYVHQKQVAELSARIDHYKRENGILPATLAEVAPAMHRLGVNYVYYPETNSCILSYGSSILGLTVYSNRSGTWKEEPQMD